MSVFTFPLHLLARWLSGLASVSAVVGTHSLLRLLIPLRPVLSVTLPLQPAL